MKTLIKLIIITTAFYSCGVFAGQYHFSYQIGSGEQDLPPSSNGELIPPPPPPYSGGGVGDGNNGSGSVWRLSIGYAADLTPRFLFGYDLGYATLSAYNIEDYQFSDTQTGEITDSWTANWNTSYIDLLATSQYRISQRLSLLGNLGVAEVMQKTTWQAAQETVTGADIQTDVLAHGSSMASRLVPEIVLGVAYQPWTQVSLDLKYNYIFADKLGTTESELSDLHNQRKIASVSDVFLGINILF